MGGVQPFLRAVDGGNGGVQPFSSFCGGRGRFTAYCKGKRRGTAVFELLWWEGGGGSDLRLTVRGKRRGTAVFELAAGAKKNISDLCLI